MGQPAAPAPGGRVLGKAPLRLATRGSELARRQAELVAELLRPRLEGRRVELVVVETTGDRRADLPLSAFGATGVFVAEVERAVLEGRADVAVHSAKDLPSGAPPEGLVLESVPLRDDPRDALVGRGLDALGQGALVASGSPRRRAQLAALRPDLRFVELRGNIATRLARVPEGGSIVVAAAALRRLGLADRAAEVLSTSTMLPQVGQGAIALRCRQDDAGLRALLSGIDDVGAHRCLAAERAFLARLGGGCDAPVAAHARLVGTDPAGAEVLLEAMAAGAGDGELHRARDLGGDPERLGERLGERLARAVGGPA